MRKLDPEVKLQRQRERSAKYRRENPEKVRDQLKQWNLKNKERKAKMDADYRERNKEKLSEKYKLKYQANPEYYKNRTKNYRENTEYANYNKKWQEENKEYVRQKRVENREKTNDYLRNRRSSDESYRLLCNLRRRINHFVSGDCKSARTMELIGCSIEFLKKHLEKQFTEGMSWDNYGRNGWVIDHIVPCALFDLTKDYQQKSCFNWQNLQPLWAEDNKKKGDTLEVCPI